MNKVFKTPNDLQDDVYFSNNKVSFRFPKIEEFVKLAKEKISKDSLAIQNHLERKRREEIEKI